MKRWFLVCVSLSVSMLWTSIAAAQPVCETADDCERGRICRTWHYDVCSGEEDDDCRREQSSACIAPFLVTCRDAADCEAEGFTCVPFRCQGEEDCPYPAVSSPFGYCKLDERSCDDGEVCPEGLTCAPDRGERCLITDRWESQTCRDDASASDRFCQPPALEREVDHFFESTPPDLASINDVARITIDRTRTRTTPPPASRSGVRQPERNLSGRGCHAGGAPAPPSAVLALLFAATLVATSRRLPE